MRFTLYTDYSFRVLTYLALNKTGELATIKEIAGKYAISQNHLMKVVHRLGQIGYIQTLRGRQGGIALALDPSEIVLGDVIRRCEDDMRLVECFDPLTNKCPIARACALPRVFNEALGAFLSVLDNYTLADLLGPREGLASILKLRDADI